MAKFISNFEVEGSLLNQTYYRTRGKSFVKRKSGVSRDRILTDKSFARTRENGSEFGAAARAGKLLRYAFAPLVKDASDSLLTSRLTQVMTKIKNFDTQSIRGDRSVAIGINTSEGQALLTGFNFNKNAVLQSVLHKPYAFDIATGIITIRGLVPMIDVMVPEGTTNISFTGAVGKVDFENAGYKSDYTNTVNLPYNGRSADVTLTPDAFPAGDGALFYLLHIAFFQEVNGVQYPLNNGGYNTLAILGVEPE